MGRIENDVSMASFTTFKIGGKASYFTRVKNVEELKAASRFAENEGQNGWPPVFILGGGSNVLISDDGFPGLVIKMEMMGKEWGEEEGSSILLRAAAGENWDSLVAESINRGLSGFENLSGIPGTVGASVIQNIGAYGAEIKDLVHSVEVFDLSTAEIKILENKDCNFDYRHSIFKNDEGKNLVVLNVTYRLSKRATPNLSYKDLKNHFDKITNPTLLEIRNAVLKIRQSKFPDLNKFGTAGSFFKNPIISKNDFNHLLKRYPEMPNWPTKANKIKISAAWLIDKIANLKGFNSVKVGSYQNQSLVIVNLGNASASEIKKFTGDIKNKIKKETGIILEEEVRYIE